MPESDLEVRWFNTTFYPQRRTARAARYEDGVLERLRSPQVTFFTPWGPRYDWASRGVEIADSHREVKTLNFLAELKKEILCYMPGKEFRWIFLGADLYGTRINGLPAETVCAYFANVQKLAERLLGPIEFRLWSEFDADAEPYRRKVQSDFGAFIDDHLLARAVQTAKGMILGGDPREYLIERFAEAMLIEERYRPIKVSCVARYKDDKVDYGLPRLYLLPEALHAPWLGRAGE